MPTPSTDSTKPHPTAPHPAGHELGFSSRIVAMFLQGPLPMAIIIATLLAGLAALYLTPREEEPQIVVPMADVFVSVPGVAARQVERQVTTPLEKLLYQIDGVENVYSMSRDGQAIVTVRFYVGQSREDSLVKLYNKLLSNTDLVPPLVAGWVVKPVEIDDVPIVVATLWSDRPAEVDDAGLRRLAEEVELKLQSVQNTNKVTLVGGRPRTIRVELHPEALAARRTTPLDVADALRIHNTRLPAGEIDQNNHVLTVEAGDFIRSVSDLDNIVVNVVDGTPVYLKDVATILDGPAEADSYTWLSFGPASPHGNDARDYPAVSIAIAKKKGTNAVWVARDVEAKLHTLSETLFPAGVHYTITRDYGETADEKVNDLVEGLVVAVLTVVLLIGVVLGWRAAFIIALAIPVCYGATLLINYLAGYTINRVTLFALILALGILVDDPITDVENVERYYRMGRFKPRDAILIAVQEIRPALIMSTIAVILSFIPMFFITGMMGPYMRPMALNVPLTIAMSLLVAFCVTPWLCRVILKPHPNQCGMQNAECGIGNESSAIDDHRAGFEAIKVSPIYKIYDVLLRPLIHRRWAGVLFLGVTGVLFFISIALPAFRLVPLKMLPFDNKNEFQIIVDMDEGTTLETTEGATRALATYLHTVPEVANVTGTVGLASPMDFNGMVRHYFLRQGPNVADLRVNLLGKKDRAQQSHAILLRIRKDLEAVAAKWNANIKLVETPPGPPVLETVVAEIRGDADVPYTRLQHAALVTADRLRREPDVVDVDTSVEADASKLTFVTDKEKAALSGVGTADIAQTLALAIGGLDATTLNLPDEAQPLPIDLRLPRPLRNDLAALDSLQVMGRPGVVKQRAGASLVDAPRPLVAVGELGKFEQAPLEKTIYHKDLQRVAYVYADTAGRAPADVILDVAHDLGGEAATTATQPRALAGRTYFSNGGGIPWTLPAGTNVGWRGEGEWKITLDVFRDLGIAFGAACVAIFFVLMLQTGSATLALIMITSIPLTMIGIMPGFWLLNALGAGPVGGFPNPTFFTATAMIGMIALAGIVVRNSVVLVEFIHDALEAGLGFDDALVAAGAIRFRPIFLTAGTAMLGMIVITLDPIFSGLAWSIIFGVGASTIFTLGVIPVIYALVYAHRPGHGLPAKSGAGE